MVEHPVYDVWPKSCEMTYPAGPAGTRGAGRLEQPVERQEIGRRADRRRRGRAERRGAAAAPPPSAADSNAT